ncbi:Putative pectinesterase/pectinesterase inhibitor 35 [Fusarium oxysporum f. sp. cubense race 1]|uniref:pectinesterase n=1 Tax=Fusarium oxysporum f. sp. cubense (strain race 1) TaxID=1229664 RepID=N4UFP5_FUSC1|nr:Putative pectinesterase/pectinesterase inhibitor 35 [Fusarium oxysporum f. sp. cubense race 1]
MARLSAWLLLPLVCGSSLAKEGSVVPAFVDSSSSHSTRFASLHDTPLNGNVPIAPGGSSSFTPQVNPLVKRSSACKPRQPQGVWGYSKAFFHQCYIASNTANAYITANNRKSSSWAGGFIFDKCKVTYTDSYGSNFGTTSLGRPWSQYALVVYMNSFLDKHISPQGWATWSSNNPQTSVSLETPL